MKNKTARLGVVAAGLLALVAGLTPPAHATTISAAAFIGSTTLSGPLGYPCTPTTTVPPTITLPCPPSPTVHGSLPLPGFPTPPQFHIDPGGHDRTVLTIGSTTCQNVVVNIDKLNKAPAHAGPCGFAIAPPKAGSTNHVHGYCGLSGGQVRVFFTDALGQLYLLDIHFNAVGGLLVITGHATKISNPTPPQPTSLVVGVTLAIPPLPPAPSCSTSAATTFTLVGAVAAAGTDLP